MNLLKDIRQGVAKALTEWGFSQRRSIAPFSYSGGRVVLWGASFGHGEVIVREETYQQHGARLQFDIGVRIDSIDPIVEFVKERLAPWGRCKWYPHFHFGWTLGQSSLEQLEYLKRGVEPPELENSANIDVDDRIFSMEGFKGGVMFSDDLGIARRQLSSAMNVINGEALSVLSESAASGLLSSKIIENRFRLCPHCAWSVAIAVGHSLRGEVDQALGALTLQETLLLAKGMRHPVVNHAKIQELIPAIVEMSLIYQEEHGLGRSPKSDTR